MGNTYSILEDEMTTWNEHILQFDETYRSKSLSILKGIQNETKIDLCSMDSKCGDMKYKHWFITDGSHFIEFGPPFCNIYNTNTCVGINKSDHRSSLKSTCHKSDIMDDRVRERAEHVLGMRNYSFCLRNSEHVANYIFRGRWISSQLDSQTGHHLKAFKTYMSRDQLQWVNTFPHCMVPHIFENQDGKVYQFLDGYYNATRFDYYLSGQENTYNVLVIGPTGAGKSHLINVLFNQPLCQSDVSHHSVTREMYFIRGKGEVYDCKDQRYVQKDVIVADTIGLCDTEWNDKLTIKLIKARVSSNFGERIDTILIVFKIDRLQKEHIANIKIVLKWLDYKKNRSRFHFICTFAENLTDRKKEELRQEAKKIFGLTRTEITCPDTGEKFSSILYMGFPPEETLNDKTKQNVGEDYKQLKHIFTLPTQEPLFTYLKSRCLFI